MANKIQNFARMVDLGPNLYNSKNYEWSGCSQSDFWIVNPIQIHHKNVIDNPNPITIQLFLEKIKGT
jgi:hypothetical protein